MGFYSKIGSEKVSQKRFLLLERVLQKVPGTPPRRVRPLRRAPFSSQPGSSSILDGRKREF